MPTLNRAERRWQGYGRAYAYTYPLPGCTLYGLEAHRQARSIAARFGVPVRWKLEASRAGVVHVHLAAPLPPIAAPEGWTYARPVRVMANYLRYLEKPADARLCEQNRAEPWARVDPSTYAREYRRALDDHGAARAARLREGKRRLLQLSGWAGVEYRPAPLLPALWGALPGLLWVCAALLTWYQLGRLELVAGLRAASQAEYAEIYFRLFTSASARCVRPVSRAAPRPYRVRPGGDRAPPDTGAGPL
ncbi:hypothetical protein [Deinococcus fonticola]|uniref:hypothetical protein n=1 Tax=Deinococcus fonticola TaxID=2528713 RepID=UPI0010751DB7|nr:hypothetical protein [Deinococcus fonticola]